MDQKNYGETKDHRDGLREVPGAVPEEQETQEESQDEDSDEEQDEQPELGSGPASS